jgi:hypothetical protein
MVMVPVQRGPEGTHSIGISWGHAFLLNRLPVGQPG